MFSRTSAMAATVSSSEKSFMGRRLTQMNADKHLVFIGVYRRLSAAIRFFLTFQGSGCWSNVSI